MSLENPYFCGGYMKCILGAQRIYLTDAPKKRECTEVHNPEYSVVTGFVCVGLRCYTGGFYKGHHCLVTYGLQEVHKNYNVAFENTLGTQNIHRNHY